MRAREHRSYSAVSSALQGKQTTYNKVRHPSFPCYVCHVKTGWKATLEQLGRTTSVHHLIPQSLHSEVVAEGRYTLNACQSKTVLLCRMCHDAAHRLFTNQTMANHLSTAWKLRSAMIAAGWLEYASVAHAQWRMPRLTGVCASGREREIIVEAVSVAIPSSQSSRY